jgi:hypothetical protein
VSGPLLLPTWQELAVCPQIVDTMRRYLDQIACVLRPGSVTGADLALRSFAAFLIETAPEVTSTVQVTRRHVEDYKPWLAKRPPGRTPRGSPRRRWRIASAPCGCSSSALTSGAGRRRRHGCRCSPATCLGRTIRCPRHSTTRPRRSCSAPPTTTTGSWSGSPSRCCCAQACGSASSPRSEPMRSSRSAPRPGCTCRSASSARTYLPLHPHLVTLIDDYRSAHVPAEHPLLLPRENGRALDRHTVTRFINKASTTAGLPHIHPHQLRHTLATQAINRGMSLEAIAAMLGHHSMDMTLRYAREDRQPHRG